MRGSAGAFDLGLKGQAAGHRRPSGTGEDRTKFGPGDTEPKRAVRPAAAFETASLPSRRPSLNCAATSSNTTSEPFSRATPDRFCATSHGANTARRVLKAMRPLRAAAFQAIGSVDHRPRRRALPASDRRRNHRARIERFRLDRSVEPRHIVKADRAPPLHLAVANRSGEPIEIEHRRLIRREPQRAAAAGVDRPGGKLAFKAEFAAQRAVRRHVETRRLLLAATRRSRPSRPAAGPAIGLELAIGTHIRAGQRAQIRHQECLALSCGAGRDVDADRANFSGQADLAAGAVGAAAFHPDAGLQRRGLLVRRDLAQRAGQRRRQLFRQRCDASKIAGLEVDRDAAARRRLRLDSSGRQRSSYRPDRRPTAVRSQARSHRA